MEPREKIIKDLKQLIKPEKEIIKQLKQFIEQFKFTPSILIHPSLYFFRSYLQSLGCDLSSFAEDIESVHALVQLKRKRREVPKPLNVDITRLKGLKKFVKQCESAPSILTDPSLYFFRDYLLSLGSNLTSSAYNAGVDKSRGDSSNKVSEEDHDASQTVETTSKDNLDETSLQERKKKMKIKSGGFFSRIPDEILVSILSLLPTKQSVQTSVLAKRWQDLWKRVSCLNLNFHSYKIAEFNFLTKWTIASKNMMNKYKIEHILSICLCLEEFTLIGSHLVFNLKITVKSLKKLTILGCCQMERLELFTPNLVSFKYNGPDIKINFADVPRLVEVSFVDSYCFFLVMRDFEQFEPVLYQIKRVNLILDFPYIDGCPLVNGLHNLKELRLDMRIWDTQQSSYLFWSLLVCFPCLDVFFLHLYWPDNFEVLDFGTGDFEELEQTYSFKVFEVDRCTSSNFELAFIEYVLESADELEKLVVRVARRASVESDEDLMGSPEREDAMKKAREYIDPIVSQPIRFLLL